MASVGWPSPFRATAAAAAGWIMASHIVSPLAVCESTTPLRMRFLLWSGRVPLQLRSPPRKKPYGQKIETIAKSPGCAGLRRKLAGCLP